MTVVSFCFVSARDTFLIDSVVGGIPTATSISAVQYTAGNNSVCTSIAPFYYEIGNQHQVLVNGSLPDVNNTYVYVQSTKVNVASGLQ